MRDDICKSCGAPVVWIDMADLPKSQICERKPKIGYTTDGKLTKVYESHFAFCPNAAQHRKADAA